MAKDQIRKIIDDSKKSLEQDHERFTKSIKDDLASFKKKTLDRV